MPKEAVNGIRPNGRGKVSSLEHVVRPVSSSYFARGIRAIHTMSTQHQPPVGWAMARKKKKRGRFCREMDALLRRAPITARTAASKALPSKLMQTTST